MNRPAIRSFTRLCAPKPSATPTIPALASSGARLKPSSPMTSRIAMVKTTAVTKLRSTEPIASARCRRRSGMNCPSSAAGVVRSFNGFSSAGMAAREVLVASRLIARCSSQRSSMAARMMPRMRSGFTMTT
jgi:hypothetical protein